ncbi:hypothetical protein KSAC_31450 (plasmid) [Komagataeibacter saccharivorans]|uniref:hypothetical protein n=1 Tax=Komagataeibacter saccharivorans TaxID=265959 RepID=UPI001044C34B|nr:hypothetical protein [Komagataeibacter saccharivorans]QBL95324.1 hypothetical protein KSAC_31450 [Komagataeibacter saccharivorans]
MHCKKKSIIKNIFQKNKLLHSKHTQKDISDFIRLAIPNIKEISDFISIKIKSEQCIRMSVVINKTRISNYDVEIVIDNDLTKDKFNIKEIKGECSQYEAMKVTIKGLAHRHGKDDRFYDSVNETQEEISYRIFHVVIHELVHALQIQFNENYFRDGHGSNAVRLGREAERAEHKNSCYKEYKYLNYLNCESEHEAHSYQMASEVYITHVTKLSKNEYKQKAKNSDLADHIYRKKTGKFCPISRFIFWYSLNRLVKKSWKFYSTL